MSAGGEGEPTLTGANAQLLTLLSDIHDVSVACATTTFIWGGLTLDVLTGRFLREHHDVDGFTLNLLDVLPEMTARFEALGYTVRFLSDFHILRVAQGEVHAGMNRLERDGERAMWRHIGDQGTVFFPFAWLDGAPRDFCGVPVTTAGVELDYALKANVRLLSPEWAPREKDVQARAILEEELVRRGIAPEDVLARVWSVNPFWAARGYAEYAEPVYGSAPSAAGGRGVPG